MFYIVLLYVSLVYVRGLNRLKTTHPRSSILGMRLWYKHQAAENQPGWWIRKQ